MLRTLRECKTNAKGGPEVTALIRQAERLASADELGDASADALFSHLSPAELAASVSRLIYTPTVYI